METSLITQNNAIKATRFLLNLDASFIKERYHKLADPWVQNLIRTKGELEQSQRLNPVQSDRAMPVLETKLAELANNAKDLSNMLMPEAQEKLRNYLLINNI